MSDRVIVFAGWWLFVACALLFIVFSLGNGGPLALAGSVCLLAAHAALMAPLCRARARGREQRWGAA